MTASRMFMAGPAAATQIMSRLGWRNAAKFTEAGTITLSVHRRKGQAGDWVEMEVRDTGIGIASADMSRLFKDFGQASRATSGKSATVSS